VVRVRKDQCQQVRGLTQKIGRHVQVRGCVPLAHVCDACIHPEAAFRGQFNPGRGIVRHSRTIPHAVPDTRQPCTPPLERTGPLFPRFPALPQGVLGQPVQTLCQPNGSSQHRSGGRRVPATQKAGPAEPGRIHFQTSGQNIHDLLHGRSRLGHSESPERTSGRVVGIHRPGIDDNVGNPIRASCMFSSLGQNLSFHRMLVRDPRHLTARIVEHRGTHTAWRKQLEGLPIAVCIGLPPHVLLAAAMSPAKGVDEATVAHALAPTPLVRAKTVPLNIPAQTELVLEGVLTHELDQEGPFPDLTGTMDGVRQQPVFRVTAITHRRDPIFHALLPAGLEHKNLMGMPREPTIFAEVNKVARCTGVSITPGGCSWLHAVVQIDKQGPEDGREAIEAAFRGHSSLKHVVVVDTDVNIYDPHDVEWAVATRFQATTDLVTFRDQPSSSLDPSARQVPCKKARSDKLGIDATIPWGAPKQGYTRVRYEA